MSKKLPLQLRTNVKHPYDYCFSKSAQWVFLRMYNTPYLNKTDVPRREMFARLEAAGIQTVPNGIVEEVLRKYDPAQGVVVYVDERAHRGEGKFWLSAKEALEQYPNHWCSVFMGPKGQALRHFQFGDQAFTMPFHSRTDWRSQRGESYSYCVPGSRWSHLFLNHIHVPYFALDFIPGTDMATDFQYVPGIENDRLDNWMRPREMYDALCRASFQLLEAGVLEGSKERGYGVVSAGSLGDEDAWLEQLGEHVLTSW